MLHTIMSSYHDGMVRVQVQFTEEQIAALRDAAASEGCSIAEVARRGADLYLSRLDPREKEKRKRRALRPVGKFASTSTDVSSNHDQYLAEDFR